MRFYFNLKDTEQSLPDKVGVEVTNFDEARRFAIETVAEVIQEDQETDWRGWHLEGTDSSGRVLFTISLDQVVSGHGSA